jgi:hypothetical protein
MTPLLGIRVKQSDVPGLRTGHQFDAIEDFDAVLKAVRAAGATGRVGFVLTWKNRATFHGVYDLERREGLVEHVGRVCREALREPRLEVLLPGIRWTLKRLFEAALAERESAQVRHVYVEEGSCRTDVA